MAGWGGQVDTTHSPPSSPTVSWFGPTCSGTAGGHRAGPVCKTGFVENPSLPGDQSRSSLPLTVRAKKPKLCFYSNPMPLPVKDPSTHSVPDCAGCTMLYASMCSNMRMLGHSPNDNCVWRSQNRKPPGPASPRKRRAVQLLSSEIRNPMLTRRICVGESRALRAAPGGMVLALSSSACPSSRSLRPAAPCPAPWRPRIRVASCPRSAPSG